MRSLLLVLLLSRVTQTPCSRIRGFRGGAVLPTPPSIERTVSTVNDIRSLVVTISTGSRYLDRRKLLRVPANVSVAEVKEMLSNQFPGCPPVGLQRLFLGSRLLSDTELIGEITELSPVPLALDMLSGTNTYNRTVLSVSDALQMLTALYVHSAANVAQQMDLMSGKQHNISDSKLNLFRDMFMKINSSLYISMRDDIERALIAEKDPEKDAADTAPWRNVGTGKPLVWTLLGTLNMNFDEIKSAAVTSVLLSIYASWGTSSAASKYFITLGILLYWLSKLRPLRYYCKVLVYFLLPQLVANDFALPLVSTPYQALARFFHNQLNGQSSVNEKIKDVLPGSAKNWRYKNRYMDNSIIDNAFRWLDAVISIPGSYRKNHRTITTVRLDRGVSPIIRNLQKHQISTGAALQGPISFNRLDKKKTCSARRKKKLTNKTDHAVHRILREALGER